MKEKDGIGQLRQIQRREWARIKALAEQQGLKQSSEHLGIWLPRDQEEKVGSIPSKFFAQKYGKEDEVVFDEHRINFPIIDPSQLSECLKALNALYSRVENIVVYDRNDPTRFVEFVSGLAESKQPGV